MLFMLGYGYIYKNGENFNSICTNRYPLCFQIVAIFSVWNIYANRTTMMCQSFNRDFLIKRSKILTAIVIRLFGLLLVLFCINDKESKNEQKYFADDNL